MATALQKQLAAIAVSSTHQLDLKAQKAAHGKSLLFEPKIAASQSFENLYLICYEGYRDLCALDPRFLHFSKSLFSEQSKVEDRTQMTKKENEKLDTVLETFITLVGPRLLLKPAEKALEWLVRRFQIHEYNTECLVFSYLPYHNTPQFLALLSILPSNPSPALRFLFPYIQSPTNPPRQTIIYTAINTAPFFNALQSYMVRVLQAGHQGSNLISFWSSVTAQAIDGILDNSTSGRKEIQDQKREELLLRVLPVLNNCMRLSSGAEMNTACYMIIIVLVTKAAFEDKVLDSLMEATILSQDNETLDACLMCLAIVAEERSQVPIPVAVSRRLLRIPNLAQTLASISNKCRVERLALGCAVNALGSGSARHGEVYQQILDLNLLGVKQTQVALAALLQVLQDSTLGSEEHGQLLDLAAKLCESPVLASSLQSIAKQTGADLAALGFTADLSLDSAEIDGLESEDEEMIDVDEDAGEDTDLQNNAPEIELPRISTSSFLDADAFDDFQKAVDVFKQAVASNQITRFLSSSTLRKDEAVQDSLFFTFLMRTWCSQCPASVRVAALRAVTTTIKKLDKPTDLQVLIPYLLFALTDSFPIVRRSAAACITVLSKIIGSTKGKKGLSTIYGKVSSKISTLSGDEASSFLSSVVIPVLEECVMDPNFIIASIRDILEGKQTSTTQHKQGLKASLKTSLLSFLGSHTALTPLLRVRLCLIQLFGFIGKISAAVRTNTILPTAREWCSLDCTQATRICAEEGLDLGDADRDHLATLMAKEPESINLLTEIISGNAGEDRTQLLDAAFDRLNALWPSLKSDARLSLGQCLLDLTLKDADNGFDTISKERSLETLRSVKLDTDTLITFLGSVPSAVQMPEGPPAKKRRRTSRNEMARVELQSPDDLSRLLQKLTLVLELIDESNPGQHPALFKNLFGVLGELQQLKQQSGSELVYLQSLILSSLTPIVSTLRERKDTADYQAAVRADLLIDCIRHSASPQVQNSALLLIANLASWVPELILHNLMPIFTFIGSTLLRQQDDYSAHVVDQTISRVVPQLAASLRAKHKHFLTGVADLLLSFTAAFEHVPQHRRLKLFSELARTLGPEDSLSAIIALLVDRYHNSKTQRRFATDLLLAFDPVLTLQAFKGYLDLVIDAAGPKHKVSDTLFSLNEKQPAQVESALGNLLSSLADLAAEERLRAHVTRAFRRKIEQNKPRETFATIVETIILLSNQVAGQHRLYEGCRRVLARCLDLLPTTDLIKSAELLLSNSDYHVQVAAIKSIEVRAGTVVQNDRLSVSALLSFLPSIENVLQTSGELDPKIISVSCIDRIIERFGKKDVSAVASVAQTISGPQSLSSGDDRVRILSLLCLTSIVDVLEDEAISLLPTVLPTAFEYLRLSIEQEKTGLHNAVYSLLSNVVERLGYMFSREYMVPALKLSQRSAAANLEDACDESRRQFYQSVSEHLGPQEAFAAIKTTWPDAVKQGFEASLEQVELIRSSVDGQIKSKLIKSSAMLFSLLLEVFDIRNAIESNEEEFDDEEVEQLESTFIEAVIAMILKLNDATFRPFFIQLVELVSSSEADKLRSITFYKFLSVFFDKFKSIVTGYSSYIVEHGSKLLEYLSKDNAESELRNAVLSALQKTFQHDQDGFWQAPSHFGAIMNPLLKQLTIDAAEEITSDAIPAITELAAASSSSMDNHREMNSVLLKYMRAEEAHTRLATVLCEQSLTKRLGEEWLGLLPEMLPFISELREDDDEMVERETQRWITMVEQILGEDLDVMLQ